MSIRTNRGRAAALRKLWSWPLRSARHLIASIIILIVLLAGGTTAIAMLSSSHAPTDAAPTTSSPPSTTPPASATTTATTPSTTNSAAVTTPPPPAADPVQQAGSVVRDFMTNWVQAAGKSTDAWAASLAPYTVPEYMTQLRTVDPARLGGVSVTGPATPADVTASVIEWNQPTTLGTIKVTTVLYEGAWKVKRYDLAGTR